MVWLLIIHTTLGEMSLDTFPTWKACKAEGKRLEIKHECVKVKRERSDP
jgi:hypothetical protein